VRIKSKVNKLHCLGNTNLFIIKVEDTISNYCFKRIVHESHIHLRGSIVVKVLCYKSEGGWFDPSWYHWNFLLT